MPWVLSFLNGFIVISFVFRLLYRWLPGRNGAVKGFVFGFLGWAFMNLMFFPLLGLGVFALNCRPRRFTGIVFARDGSDL